MANSAVGGIQGSVGAQSTTSDAYANLNIDDFMKLLISELQNQDPLDPVKNKDLVEQIGQIRAIQANQYLTTTLTGVMLGQNLNTAAAMLGRKISGLDDSGKEVQGKVTGVVFQNGAAKLHVGDQVVSLSNVQKILPDQPSEGSTAQADTEASTAQENPAGQGE